MSSFLRDTISVGLSKSLIIACSLAKSVIVARWLGPEGNGLIAALLVYPSLFMTIGSLGIRQAVTYMVGSNPESLDHIKTAVVQIWAFSSLLSLCSSYYLITSFSTGGNESLLVLLSIAPIPFSLFNTYNTGIFLGQNKIKQFNRINWLPQLIVLLAVIVVLPVLELGVNGVLAAYIVGPAILALFYLTKSNFFSTQLLRVRWPLVTKLLRLGSIYAISLLIINLNYRVDIILLDKLSTTTELGIYSKGSQLIEYLWQIPMLLSTIVFARSSTAKDKKAFSEKVVVLMQASFVVVALGSLVLALLAPFVISLLFGSDFARSALVLQILLPGVVLLTAFKVMNMDLAGRGKPWIAMKAMTPALVVNIVLNILLIPSLGAKGAAIASTISYGLAGVAFLIFYCRETEIPLKSAIIPSKSKIEGYLLSRVGKRIPATP